MSQHTLQSFYQGQRMTILMGWDRPLRGYFMVIEHPDRDGTLYCNLDDPELASHHGLPPTVELFVEQLQDLQIEVPMTMLEAVELDGVFNVGNRYVDHGATRAGSPQ